ncbi:hypothetical protein ACU4GD_42310 [Cupriavidus basilensis]
MRGLGSDNVDFRQRQTAISSAAIKGAPWLGLPIADVSALQRVAGDRFVAAQGSSAAGRAPAPGRQEGCPRRSARRQRPMTC